MPKHMFDEKFCTDEDDEDYKNRKKVKDQWHYTEKFRGAAHSICNLRYKVLENIPIVIHNASFSDDDKTITHKLNFIDSFSFMTASLSDLVDSMSKIFISKLCIKCMGKNKIKAECKFNWLKGDELE